MQGQEVLTHYFSYTALCILVIVLKNGIYAYIRKTGDYSLYKEAYGRLMITLGFITGILIYSVVRDFCFRYTQYRDIILGFSLALTGWLLAVKVVVGSRLSYSNRSLITRSMIITSAIWFVYLIMKVSTL